METQQLDTERILKMIKPEGFNALFEENLSEYDTYQAAFDALNEEFEAATGEQRYASYESFRICRARRLNK